MRSTRPIGRFGAGAAECPSLVREISIRHSRGNTENVKEGYGLMTSKAGSF